MMGGLWPVVTWGTLGALAAYRWLVPGYKTGKTEVTTMKAYNDTKTSKVVDMVKSASLEIAKAAPITVLFNTVGVGALSL